MEYVICRSSNRITPKPALKARLKISEPKSNAT